MRMTNELIFRIIFTILWLVFITNMTWIRYKTRKTADASPTSQAIRHESRIHIVALAMFAPFWFGGILLYIIFPSVIAFLSIPLPDWFRILMVCVAVPSIPFTFWGYQTIGKNWVHAFESSKFLNSETQTLVTNGPYRYVRNPIYLGSFLFIVSIALVAANWLILLPAIILIILVYLQIKNEEAMLIDRFGDEYREYMKRTPRLIPRLFAK